MQWKKLGPVITPQKRLWWMQTHAFVPTVDSLEGDLYRVYVSGRNNQNQSYVGYADIDLSQGGRAVAYSLEPALGLGELGCFDDNGVTPSCVVNHGGEKRLYYIGWNKRSRVRMSLISGLATSSDGGRTFERFSRAPILDRTDLEPYNILTGPCVLVENGLWRMWYVSCTGWINEDLPSYNIKYAESDDGIHWRRNGHVCIDFMSLDEHSLARPWVLKRGDRYCMWYSYKGEHYRIGYAESPDGLSWERMDDRAGIDVSSEGGDSVMVCTCCVFEHGKNLYMLYNGNDYGMHGVFLAMLEE